MSYGFFLAHAGPDKAQAERLYDLLSSEATVFLDTKSLLAGDDWDRGLAEAQRDSRVTVVLVSAETDTAFYQREEIAAAIHMARADPKAHRVVPVYLDASRTRVPYGLLVKVGFEITVDFPLERVARELLDLDRRLAGGTAGLATVDVPAPVTRQSQPRVVPVRSALRRLRDLLSELISREDEAKRVARDGGVPIGAGWWSSDPAAFWEAVLDDANRARRMEELFSVIDEILGDNQDWGEAKLEYRTALSAGSRAYLHPVKDEPTATVSLALHERRLHSLRNALAKVVPSVFRDPIHDPLAAVDRLAKARSALQSIGPLITAMGAAASLESEQPRRDELQGLYSVMLGRRTAVLQDLRALGQVRSDQEAVPLCNDLAEAARELLDACTQAIQYVT